ncbi:aminotransferase class V-fold PLP-dependent enzyme [Nocardioides marmoriginsengisoli]|uniref:Aminotransferase class V-fold PLP-dependent enzyme n=1 Tax=Nocardioides marmoriginsengisoli TaxID=661483 RepID=A0A3N0CGZ7_9ACTN|nr:aminotransferase class V-fold PLP-dependent enzyme [Nocardioides marmoriginsengisoli]RNL62521.1 aminotransferase class V-fold PLP-dependent enzyme [Nocardioides marmoriginsengisoli]
MYERIGAVRVVNAVGPATRFGGVPLSAGVLTAMSEATAVAIDIEQLQLTAGRHLAGLLGVPGAYVTPGASAALLLGTAAALTRTEARLIDALPTVLGTRDTVVVQAAHRDPYDHAITATGARLVEVGYPGTTRAGEVARALDERTAAVLYRPGRPGEHVGLRELADLAHRAGAVVIVDGALHVPPVDRLHEYFEQGADLVAVSGGKCFRGPQASGLLLGDPALLTAAALHHQDMDVRDATWGRRPGRDGGGAPRQGIGRSLKLGREQLLGLVVAVEEYLAGTSADALGEAELAVVAERLAAAGTTATWHHDPALDVRNLEVPLPETGADDLLVRLAGRPVPVFVEEGTAWRGVLALNPMALVEGDGAILADALLEELARSGRPA